MNGSMWMEVDRIILRMQTFTDAFSRRWGGILKCPNGVFWIHGGAGGSQRDLEVNEAVDLKNSLALYCASNLDKIKGKTVIVKVDNISYI